MILILWTIFYQWTALADSISLAMRTVKQQNIHLAFHRKGTPPALRIGSSSSCSRISVLKTMKSYHGSSAKAPTSSKFNACPTKKHVLCEVSWAVEKMSSDKWEIFWWLLQHWYNDINTWKLYIYIYIYQNIKMNRC